MNPVADFFRRHHAVPAGSSGPAWSQAPEAVLLDWFRQYAAVCRCGWNGDAGREATPEERRGMLPTYQEIVTEVHARAAREGASPAIVGASIRANLPREV